MKPMTPLQWRAAVDLLMTELGTTHTLMAQLYNDPESMRYIDEIPRVMETNRMIMNTVEMRIGKQGLRAPRKKHHE